MHIPIVVSKKCTVKQEDHINQLVIDLRISDRKQKYAHISDICGRTITHVSDLGQYEAGRVIDKFLEWKDNRRMLNNGLNK